MNSTLRLALTTAALCFASVVPGTHGQVSDFGSFATPQDVLPSPGTLTPVVEHGGLHHFGQTPAAGSAVAMAGLARDLDNAPGGGFGSRAGDTPGTQPRHCLADWNADGMVNTLDIIAYLNDYDFGRLGVTPAGPDPDLRPPKGLDTADVLDFLNLYRAGC